MFFVAFKQKNFWNSDRSRPKDLHFHGLALESWQFSDQETGASFTSSSIIYRVEISFLSAESFSQLLIFYFAKKLRPKKLRKDKILLAEIEEISLHSSRQQERRGKPWFDVIGRVKWAYYAKWPCVITTIGYLFIVL